VLYSGRPMSLLFSIEARMTLAWVIGVINVKYYII